MRRSNHTASSPPRSPRAAEAELRGFVEKFDSTNAKTIRAARRILRRRFPAANELVYDNYNFFVIGYSPTERPSDTIVSLAAAANGIGLSFYNGAGLPDPTGILLGSGKQNRFVRLPTAATLDEPAVNALIEAAIQSAKIPLPSRGRGRTIIKGISAKQRPRRST
jgi:hypothetical protein